MILITGATGTIGSEVVRLLAADGVEVRAMTRNPEKADLPGVEVVRGDYDDPESLAAAAEGAGTLFLATAPGPWIETHDQAMLAAARAAGVRKVVKLSAIGTGETDVRVGNWHLPGEQALRASGMSWTLLRPSSYASNTLRWAAPISTGDPIPNQTGNGGQGVIDPRDVAEVAARALLDDHTGQILTLTGPESLSVPDQVAQLSQVLGRELTTKDISLDTAREQMIAAGIDPAFVEVAVDGSAYIREDRNAIVTGDVERVLGRPPRSYRTWAQDHRTAFDA
jgi:uncharacterized protein YbjT (DUF2867 family)